MPKEQQTDFWTHLADTAYWQVILLFLTALITSLLTQFFIARYKKTEKLRACKIAFRQQSYLLGQMLHNRAQDIIHENVYEVRIARSNLDEKMQDAMIEQTKITVGQIAQAALDINEVYGKILEQLTEIQLLVGDEAFKDLEPKIRRLLNVRSTPVPDLELGSDEKAVLEYLETATEAARKHIAVHVMMPMDEIYEAIKPLKRVKLFT